jgi:stage IV sporulation protein FB
VLEESMDAIERSSRRAARAVLQSCGARPPSWLGMHILLRTEQGHPIMLRPTSRVAAGGLAAFTRPPRLGAYDWWRMNFRVLSMPVRVEPAFFLTAGILAASRLRAPWLLASWIAVVFVSVLFHELGHALAFRRLGYSPSIRLHAMGGHTSASAALSPRRDLIVSLAGPSFGLALGALIYGLSLLFPEIETTPFVGVVASDLVWVNFGWGIINLLPILPMDGGRVLVAGLRLADPLRATSRAHRISMIAAGLAAAAAILNGMLFAGLMAAMFAVDNYRACRQP